MSFWELSDGMCNSVVFVRAEPEAIVNALGRTLESGSSEEIEPEAVVCREGDWSHVFFLRSAMEDREERYIDSLGPKYSGDSGPLLHQVEQAIAGTVPNAPLMVSTPLTTAALLAKALGAETIATWGSDQGLECVGLATFAANGSLSLLMNAAGPSELSLLAESNGWEDPEPENPTPRQQEVMDLLDEVEEGFFVLKDGTGGVREGDICDECDEFLESLGMDLDLLTEPWLEEAIEIVLRNGFAKIPGEPS